VAFLLQEYPILIVIAAAGLAFIFGREYLRSLYGRPMWFTRGMVRLRLSLEESLALLRTDIGFAQKSRVVFAGPGGDWPWEAVEKELIQRSDAGVETTLVTGPGENVVLDRLSAHHNIDVLISKALRGPELRLLNGHHVHIGYRAAKDGYSVCWRTPSAGTPESVARRTGKYVQSVLDAAVPRAVAK